FCRQRPNLNVSIEGLPSSVIRDGVTTGHYDIGITAFPFNRESLIIYPLEDKAVVAMPTGHRLARKKTIRAQDLHDQDFVLLRKPSTHPINNILHAVRRHQAIQTSFSVIACILVAERMGIAIVDPFSASEYVGRGVVLRPLEPPMTIGTAVVCSRSRPLSAIAQTFLHDFLEYSREFLNQAKYSQP
ncbi:MAG TPA: LysR substrate-binding domain-containing protein, partial [Acetobacteraceae bacterium]